MNTSSSRSIKFAVIAVVIIFPLLAKLLLESSYIESVKGVSLGAVIGGAVLALMYVVKKSRRRALRG